MKKTLLLVSIVGLSLAGQGRATLIAGWDFQTTTTGGTASTASATGVPSPLVYNANFGSGTIYLDGSNGSSTWLTGVANPQVTGFGGSTVNTAGTSFATTTSGASSLALANSTANGKIAVFKFDMTAYTDLYVTYATQRTSTGFNSQVWDYSTNGTTWTNITTKTITATSFALTDLGVNITQLAGFSTAYLRLTVTGASAAAGNNRIDNIQFSTIPEPHQFGLAFAGLLGVLIVIRRRRQAQTI